MRIFARTLPLLLLTTSAFAGPAGPPNIIDTQNFSQLLTDEQLHSIGQSYADSALGPEPGTFLLGGLSLAALLWCFRRRIRASALPEVFTSPVFTWPKKS